MFKIEKLNPFRDSAKDNLTPYQRYVKDRQLKGRPVREEEGVEVVSEQERLKGFSMEAALRFDISEEQLRRQIQTYGLNNNQPRSS